MNIYEIDAAMQSLIDKETGEIVDYDSFLHLQMSREEKIENVALWIKNLKAEIKAIKEEEDSLTARRKSAENKANRLMAYLKTALCGEKFSTARCEISYRKSQSLDVDDPVSAAEWLDSNGYPDLVVYSEPKLDKRSVSKLIKSGMNIPGCELVDHESMTVR